MVIQLSFSRFPRAQHGFTLIELSIVLVIIGLLIGGILVGQSLIDSAKLSSQVSQLQQFDAGVMAFKAQYKYLPGDAPAFGGDGDGLIDITAASGSDDYATVFTGEIANFWNNLNPLEFASYPSDLLGTAPLHTGSSKNVPKMRFGKEGSFAVATTLAASADNCYLSGSVHDNYYVILDSTQGTDPWGEHMFSSNSSVNPSELLALDSKMDDGIANTGNVQAGAIGSYPNAGEHGGPVSIPLPTCASGDIYTVANTGYECTPLIRIGGIAGDPQ